MSWGGRRKGSGRPREDSKAATTTIYLSAEARSALTATLRPGESRSAYVAAAVEREAAARSVASLIDTRDGRGRIAGRRLLVRTLDGLRRGGESDAQLVANYDLTPDQLRAAWAYADAHRGEMDEDDERPRVRKE